METWEVVVQAISNTGFPIVVALYSLIRLEKTVKDNTSVVTRLMERLDREG